jgi:hypothetical protein
VSFRIVWRPEPFDVMGRIISGHPEHRGLLAAALRELSRTLGANPAEAGESRVTAGSSSSTQSR